VVLNKKQGMRVNVMPRPLLCTMKAKQSLHLGPASHDEGHQKQDKEDHEQSVSDPNGGSGNTRKAERTRDEGDNEKNERIVKHKKREKSGMYTSRPRLRARGGRMKRRQRI